MASNRTFCGDENILSVHILSNTATTGYMWTLNIWNVTTGMTEDMIKFYLILINNLNSYMWLVATVLAKEVLDHLWDFVSSQELPAKRSTLLFIDSTKRKEM